MYLIYQAPSGRWVLRLRARRLIRVYTFAKYYEALDAIQALGFHLNKFDKAGRVLQKVS